MFLIVVTQQIDIAALCGDLADEILLHSCTHTADEIVLLNLKPKQ